MEPNEWLKALGDDVWAAISGADYESLGDGNTDTDSADNVARILDAVYAAGLDPLETLAARWRAFGGWVMVEGPEEAGDLWVVKLEGGPIMGPGSRLHGAEKLSDAVAKARVSVAELERTES